MPGLANDTLRRVHKQLRRAEQGEFDNPPRRGRAHVPKGARPRVVMLLEDCQSGARAECAVLVEVESTETQIVEICGDPTAGTFTLTFRGQTTAALPYNITAAELQSALESLSTIGTGAVIVDFGPGALAGSGTLYRWLVSFTGAFESEEIPALTATSSVTDADANTLEVEIDTEPDVEDSGETLTARCVIPLPGQVRLKAGAIGIALPVDSFGYVFVAIECRDCGEVADDDEEPY